MDIQFFQSGALSTEITTLTIFEDTVDAVVFDFPIDSVSDASGGTEYCGPLSHAISYDVSGDDTWQVQALSNGNARATVTMTEQTYVDHHSYDDYAYITMSVTTTFDDYPQNA